VGSVPALSGVGCWAAITGCQPSAGMARPKRPTIMVIARGQVVKHAVGVEAGKFLAVVGIGRSVGKQDFREAVRAGVGHQAGKPGFGQDRQRGE